MRALVIYDGTTSSRKSLERACYDAASGQKAAFLILTLETIPTSQPLTFCYPILEAESERLLQEAFNIVNRQRFSRLTGEVLRCRPSALTVGIAERVNAWQADAVYLPTVSENLPKTTARSWWQGWWHKSSETLVEPVSQAVKTIDLNNLIRFTPQSTIVLTDNNNCVMRLSGCHSITTAPAPDPLPQNQRWRTIVGHDAPSDALLR